MGEETIVKDSEKVTIDEFVNPYFVEAFVNEYQPCEEELHAFKIFKESDLRALSHAYLIPSLGDPLIPCLTILKHKGFKVSVTASGEPAVFVSKRYVSLVQ